MEWNLISEDNEEYFTDLDGKEIADQDLEEDEIPVNKVISARRAIEILREQKQLETDTLDYYQ